MRQRLGFDVDDFVILFCGRIIEVKGVYELLQAVEKIQNSNIKLLVVGSTDTGLKTCYLYERTVIEKAKTMTDKVKITGYIPNEELYKYYQSADIQVFPLFVQTRKD